MKIHSRWVAGSNNKVVKETARLKRKRNRYAGRLFLAEGEDLLESALGRGVFPERVFVPGGHEEEMAERLRQRAGGSAGAAVDLFSCPDMVLARLSGLGSGSRVISVFRFVDHPLGDLRPAPGAGTFLYLAGAADPGNVGTLIRTAAAFGAGGVILGPGCADPYGAKAMRATMGSIFEVPFCLDISVRQLAAWTAETGLDIIAADPRQGKPAWEADLSGEAILALGAERDGLPETVLTAAARIVRIPQSAGAESLNVAMAGSVLLYEGLRQRMRRAQSRAQVGRAGSSAGRLKF